MLKEDSLSVTPVVHLANGVAYSLAPVTLEPSGTAAIDINDGLAKQGVAPYATLSGYVEVQYNWGWPAICGTVWNVDTTHSLIFVYTLRAPPATSAPASAQNSDQLPPPQQTLEGMWWKQEPSVTGFVGLSNLTSRSIAASVQTLDSENRPLANHTVTVSPNGTKIVQLTELLSTSASAGGLVVNWTGNEGDVAVNSSLQDPAVGYSARLTLAQRPDGSAKISQDSYAELGLMVGPSDPMMSFPSGVVFAPYSVLRNLSDQTVSATPILWWMQSGAARSAQLSQVAVAPHQTVKLDVAALLNSAGLKNFQGTFNLVLNTTGPQGALLFASGSVDQNYTYVFEVVPRAVQASAAKSLSYWNTANGNDTMVSLWNPADESQDFLFTLFYTGGHYLYPVHLEARAAHAFNISEIIHSGIPDGEGNVIPSAIQSGSAEISGSSGENQLVLITMDSGIYNVRKATCGQVCQTCGGFTSVSVVVNPFAVAVAGNTQQNMKAQWNTGANYDYTTQSNWNSSNTGIATVNSGLVNGVSVGSVNISSILTTAIPPYAYVCAGGGGQPICPNPVLPGASAPGNVIQLTLQMNQYNSIFVGADANLAGANSIYATRSPTGGTFTKSSSQSGDTFTDVTSGGPGWVVKTTTQSASAGDRTLTVTYAVSGQGQVSKMLHVTARQFAYVTNNSPTNTCTLGYGTTKAYLYTPYTHPDGAAVQAGLGLSGTAVTESFDSSPPAGTVTGDGSLNSNSQFTDRISYCSSSPLTTSATITQTISIEGYQVRQNRLQYSNSGVTYTSLGPTQ